ncbi:MAG: DUF2470 domain-containing protein [Saccharospirillaceae bacterium]|nr:DUF2470 domain-containing protein [Pseudomonadales bacterium]NRB81195.1 DUF2470 domain-containing protein [Saccharospirillaceae bacterium]
MKQRIIGHMNKDHAESNVIYAKAFGGIANAESAELIDIEASFIRLNVLSKDGESTIDIVFSPELTDPDQARKRLVDLHKQGKELLGEAL